MHLGREHDIFLGCAGDAVNYEKPLALGDQGPQTEHILTDQSMAAARRYPQTALNGPNVREP